MSEDEIARSEFEENGAAPKGGVFFLGGQMTSINAGINLPKKFLSNSFEFNNLMEFTPIHP